MNGTSEKNARQKSNVLQCFDSCTQTNGDWEMELKLNNVQSSNALYVLPYETWCKRLVIIFRHVFSLSKLLQMHKESKSLDLSLLVVSESPVKNLELQKLGMRAIGLFAPKDEPIVQEIESISAGLANLEKMIRSLHSFLNDHWMLDFVEKCEIQ